MLRTTVPCHRAPAHTSDGRRMSKKELQVLDGSAVGPVAEGVRDPVMVPRALLAAASENDPGAMAGLRSIAAGPPISPDSETSHPATADLLRRFGVWNPPSTNL